MQKTTVTAHVNKKRIERERRMNHTKYDKEAQNNVVMFHSDDIEKKRDMLDTITAIACGVLTVCVFIGLLLGVIK